MKLIFRPVKSSDTEAIYEFLQSLSIRSRYFLWLGKYDYDLAKDITSTKSINSVTQRRFVLADNADNIIGYGFAWELDCAYPSIGVVIGEKYHHQGYGTYMMSQLIRYVKSLGKEGVNGTAKKLNKKAQMLNIKMGLQVVGENEENYLYKLKF